MLANLVPDNNKPEMVYLNLGYRITGKDAISLELKTWKYAWPIGIPFGKSFEAEGEGFPGVGCSTRGDHAFQVADADVGAIEERGERRKGVTTRFDHFAGQFVELDVADESN